MIAPVKMKETMLTVIFVTYNHEDTVAKALDSILEQETIYKYEIWICEDCSTDSTLKICKQYAEKYPNKIRLIAQPKNTKLKHLRSILCEIKTRYFGCLEGDDYWCDKQKIQIAIDTLESNPEYITFAHDTLYDNFIDKTKQSLVHDIHKIDIHNPVNFLSAPYLHTSSRIYRNVIDFQKYPRGLIMGDIYVYYLFLDKGYLYYYDKIMSVYNILENGTWAGLDKKKQERNTEIAFFAINNLLDYKYDLFFTKKIKKAKMLDIFKRILGLRLGWRLYLLIMCHNIKNNI